MKKSVSKMILEIVKAIVTIILGYLGGASASLL